MDRAFNVYLDLIIADARAASFSRGVLPRHVRACLKNAAAVVETTPHVVSLCDVVAFQADKLSRCYLRNGGTDSETSETRALLLQFVEELRKEMAQCKPSARAKALGLE